MNKLLKQKARADFNQQNPVDGTHIGLPWCQRHGSGRVCLVTGIYHEPQGGHFRIGPSHTYS